ncbi:cell division protein ZapB [Treponema sp.]|uniref:cell division protein ZapB n=1 Tax=Treponema sp. TaxID=166 RepID=UPI00388F3770
MISFEQVLLLEEKVESAVKKIEQLNAENAALRSKCAELSNALNAKSEQFSSFQTDQSKIEEGILKALNRLNAVENVILHTTQTVQAPKSESNSEITESAPQQPHVEQALHNFENTSDNTPAETLTPNVDFEFGESDAVQNNQYITESKEVNSENSTQDTASQPLFDIF